MNRCGGSWLSSCSYTIMTVRGPGPRLECQRCKQRQEKDVRRHHHSCTCKMLLTAMPPTCQMPVRDHDSLAASPVRAVMVPQATTLGNRSRRLRLILTRRTPTGTDAYDWPRESRARAPLELDLSILINTAARLRNPRCPTSSTSTLLLPAAASAAVTVVLARLPPRRHRPAATLTPGAIAPLQR
jgi:hypothetical protein